MQSRFPEALYLAGLFHDIAKGRGGDHSKLGMADAREFCQTHGLPPEDIDLVEWLVGEHLTMSAVAQKEDIYEKVSLNYYCVLREKGPLKELCLYTALKAHLNVAEMGELGVGIGL